MSRDLIHVRGGSAGTAVGLDSLDAAAHEIAEMARDVAVVACRVAAVAADPDLVAGSLLSSVTGARADAALAEVVGPRGLVGDIASMVSLSSAVTAASASYRRAEAAAARAVELAQDTVMVVVGELAPEVLVGVLALDALGVDVAGVLDRVVFDEPAIADLAGGAEGLVAGLRVNPLTSPFVPARPRTDGLTSDLDCSDLDDGADEDGSDQDECAELDDGADQDYEVAVRQLADSAALWGLLSDRGRARVTAAPRPRPGSHVPRTLRDLATDQSNVGDGEDHAGRVRVIEIPQAQGSAWIVEISGTQVWDPRAGTNPFDVTTDVRSMAQDATDLADGVHQALAQAQAASVAASSTASEAAGGRDRSADQVMRVGHILGGIAAAGLASSPRFTQAHPVTHVVTMGSPVGRMPVPADIAVLSLEHTQDAVPRLDGVPNPDRGAWVTVSRDLDGAGVDRASRAHDTRLYAATAALVDESADPSVASWRVGSAAFFAADTHGDPVVRDYTVERVAP